MVCRSRLRGGKQLPFTCRRYYPAGAEGARRSLGLPGTMGLQFYGRIDLRVPLGQRPSGSDRRVWSSGGSQGDIQSFRHLGPHNEPGQPEPAAVSRKNNREKGPNMKGSWLSRPLAAVALLTANAVSGEEFPGGQRQFRAGGPQLLDGQRPGLGGRRVRSSRQERPLLLHDLQRNLAGRGRLQERQRGARHRCSHFLGLHRSGGVPRVQDLRFQRLLLRQRPQPRLAEKSFRPRGASKRAASLPEPLQAAPLEPRGSGRRGGLSTCRGRG